MKKIGNGQESRVLEHYRTGTRKNPGFWSITDEEESRVLDRYRTGTDKNPGFWSITGRERTRIPGSEPFPKREQAGDGLQPFHPAAPHPGKIGNRDGAPGIVRRDADADMSVLVVQPEIYLQSALSFDRLL